MPQSPAEWLEREYPDAASLREGLQEFFTINQLGLPSLRRALGSTNIENPNSAARRRTGRQGLDGGGVNIPAALR